MTLSDPTEIGPLRRFSVAPMMDWTDRHCRRFHRFITRRALLYTEMIPTGAILYGDAQRFLAFDPAERPLALQLGGAVPEDLARATEIAAAYGYDEINLNVGCPSDRVQQARFGACLMAEPALVAACVQAMAQASPVPVTVKTRLGIDDQDSYDELRGFVETVAAVGCRSFIVHARKAWLQGLSPKQNREIPPLDYERVYRLKQDLPELEIVINGGVRDLDEAAGHLRHCDGVMMGRMAYQSPYSLTAVDGRFFAAAEPPPSRSAILQDLTAYAREQVAAGVPVKSITRHVLGLYNGLPGARVWRRQLSETAFQAGAGAEVIEQAAAKVQAILEARGLAA